MAKKASTNLYTGPSLKIGVLGGGQLGRMMIQSAIDLDVRVEVMDPSPDAPCSSLTHRFVCGDLNDADAVFEFGKDLSVFDRIIKTDGLNASDVLKITISTIRELL